MPQITVKPGDTLRGLASQHLGDPSKWKELGNQIGITNENEAKNLQPGITINIPDSQSDTGKLPSQDDTEKSATSSSDRSIPEPSSSGGLASFEGLLRNVTNSITQQGRGETFEQVGESIDLDPSKVSAGTLSGITDFVNKQIGPSAESMYDSTISLLEEQNKRVTDQVNRLITEDALPQFEDSVLTDLANQAGMDPNVLLGIKRKQESGGGGSDDFGNLTSSQQSNAVTNFMNLDETRKKAIYFLFNLQGMTIDKLNQILQSENAEDVLQRAAENAGNVSDEEYRNLIKGSRGLQSWALEVDSDSLGTPGIGGN